MTSGKAETIARSILDDANKSYECLGVVSAPVKDWIPDMNDYGYTEALNGNPDQATRAWAASSWNFLARDLYARAVACARSNGLDLSEYR